MNDYERLREILDAHPATAPKAKSIDEILRTLFTPEEAALAVNMSYKTKSLVEHSKGDRSCGWQSKEKSGINGGQRNYLLQG